MSKKIGLMWVGAVFTVGPVIGGFGGALLVTVKTVRFEADVVTRAIADSSLSLVQYKAGMPGRFNERN